MSGARRFRHDGLRFAYTDRGSGSPLVLQHGLGGDAAQPGSLYTGTRRQITLESRGHGDTEPLGPEEALGFRTFAADLRALLDHLDVAEAVVGGVSMGAGVALRFALEQPGRVRALVLIRPAWLDKPSPPNLAIFPEIASLLRTRTLARARAELRASPRLTALREVSRAAAESALRQLDRPGARERAAVLERLPMDVPFAPNSDLSVLTMPTLVIGSRQDPVHPLESAVALTGRLPAARLAVVASKDEGEDRHRAEVLAALDELLESLEARQPEPHW